jgi:5-methylthioadenosine/S-adenosylhomocysteine deaminase
MADDLELLDWLSQRIWKFEAAHTRDTLQVSAELGISELLRTGTTCILDMATVRHTDTIFETAERMGIRANIGKCLMDRTDTNPPSLRESTSDALSEARTLLAKWHGRDQDRIRASFAPRFALSCSDQLLKQVADISKENRILIHTHACENKKEIAWIQKLTGQPNLNYLHSMGVLTPLSVIAHGVWLRDSDRRLLARTDAAITHCPSSNLKLGSGIAELPKLLEAGIKVGIGADGAACSNRLDAFQEMRLATLLHKPKFGVATIDAQKALDLATRDGAKALHWFDKVGSIEVGKSADFIMLDAIDPSTVPAPKFPLTKENQVRATGKTLRGRSIQRDWVSALVYSGHGGLVSQTWVNGKRCYLRGSTGAEGLNSPSLFTRALKAQELILKRAGFTRTTLPATNKRTSRTRPTR